MTDKVKRILRLREGGNVERCHTFPHHGSYQVSSHSYHMAILLLELHPAPTLEMIRYILYHDVLERWVGDTPAAIKIWYPELRGALKLAEAEVSRMTGIIPPPPVDPAWMKALDTIEFLVWCDEQIGMGNEAARVRWTETMEWLMIHSSELPEECKKFLQEYRWERTRDDLG